MKSSRWLDHTLGTRAWVNFAKGVAIVMVVVYHTSLYLQHAGILGVPNRLKIVLELFPMPAFFLIAGLFNARAMSFRFPQLWKRRIWPLLYLYLVWSVIRFVFYVIVPGLNGELGELPASNPISLALAFVWPSSSYWFIYALALFSLAAWLLHRLPAPVHLAIAAIISTAFTAGLINAHNVGWNRVGSLYVFYVLGSLYARPIFAAMAKVSPLRTVAVATLFIAVGLTLVVLPVRWLPFLVLVAQALAVALGFQLSAYLARIRPLAFVANLGAQSLQIYLLHLFIIVPTAGLLGLATLHVPRSVGAVLQVILVTVAIVGSLLLAKVTTRFRWLYVPRPIRLGRSRRSRRAPDLPSGKGTRHLSAGTSAGDGGVVPARTTSVTPAKDAATSSSALEVN